MKRNWTCSKCFLAFSRKWNLERHDKLIHGQYEQSGSFESSFKNKFEKPKFKSRQLEGSSYSLKHTLNDMFEFGEMLNKMSTSSQMFGRVNSLQSQVGSLQQELSYLKNHLNGLISSNWLIPLKAIQGFSGYICNKCKTFSLKPIFDVGHDKTMESRHYCNEVHPKRNYVTYQLPSDGQNKDDWASQILFSFIKNSSPFQKFIMAKDLTKSFFQISTVLGSEVARGIFGIPDRYQVHSLLNNYNIDWIDRAISSPETNIPITDGEALDFLKRVKSTYAIFEIPADNIVKKIYIGFTF